MSHTSRSIYCGCLLALSGTAAIAQDVSAFDTCRKAVGELTDARIVRMVLDSENGVEFYEVEARGEDGAEWEFKCDLAGKIVEKEIEVPGAAHPLFAPLMKIDEEQARKIALEAYPGTVSEVEYEIEDGVAIYEFDIKTADGRKMEVEVDAANGKIIEAEEEN